MSSTHFDKCGNKSLTGILLSPCCEKVNGDGNEPVDEAALLKSVEFWLNNKAQFLFIDGHVETLAPTEVKKKHFQL